MSQLKDIDTRLTILETSTSKDVQQLGHDINEVKLDTKDIKKSVQNIQNLLHRREGSFTAFRVFIPYVLTLLGVVMTLVILVGYEQRIEYEKTNTQKVEKLEEKSRFYDLILGSDND